MSVSHSDRLKELKQATIEECQKLLGKLVRQGGLPSELRIRLDAVYRKTAETAECEASLIIPKPLTYDSRGQLTSNIKGHHISVVSDGIRHFRVTIDGKKYSELSANFIEKDLSIKVNKKHLGMQTGYPSEPVGRSVWRHLVDRYNLLDKTVEYTDIKG